MITEEKEVTSAPPAIDLDALMGKVEALSPELEPHVSTLAMGLEALRHPLVYMVPYHAMMSALANEILKSKREYLAQAVKEGNWSKVIMLHERPYRVNAFEQFSHKMSDQDYWENLAWMYTDSENVDECYPLWSSLLEAERGGREHFMSEAERAFLAQLPDEIEVFRGCKGSFDDFEILDYSWTISVDVAHWFARRFEDDGFVISGVVSKSDVIGFKDNRNEKEIVCSADNVSDIRLLEPHAIRRKRSRSA